MFQVTENEEDTGPSVDSADPEERIQARRLRIQKRKEQQKREQLGEDAVAKKDTSDELGKGAKQVDESQRRLEKLQNDGLELVTNVQVAGDAREMQHQLEDHEKKHSRIEKLEAEAKTSTEKFNEISQRWSAADMKEIPSDLHEMLVEQTRACDMVIGEKNKLINQLQMDLKRSDDEYVKDLKKQSEAIDLMIERMEEQVKNLTKSYRDELVQIEHAFIDERGQMLKLNKKKWDGMVNQRREREEEYVRMRFRRVDDHENQLDSLRTNDTEEYNMVKIKLETDVQILEQQLQQMKATYQLNQEKLEYNFQVLKKRDEENMITKAQQKRKITRLQDILNSLRIKLNKQERHYKDENQNLTDEYKRIADQYKELHKKMRHFASTDWRKFEDIWKMNEEEVKGLVEKVMKADQIIHEQQLGLPWRKPDMPFMDTTGPLNLAAAAAGTKTAGEYAQEVLTKSLNNLRRVSVAEMDPDVAVAEPADVTQETQQELEMSLGAVKRLLEVLCDEAGFLVEEKLSKLLLPLQSDERSLIKLDAIFKALHINTEEDVKKLTQFFDKYLRELDQREAAADESAVEDNGEAETTDGETTVQHNDVLYILKLFVQEHIKPVKEKQKPSLLSTFAASLSRDSSQDAAYWTSMSEVINEGKLQMWEALIDALTKYHTVLNERANRIKETDALRQQNAELRMLLHQYISSKVNQELEIPPTRVLQLEYANN